VFLVDFLVITFWVVWSFQNNDGLFLAWIGGLYLYLGLVLQLKMGIFLKSNFFLIYCFFDHFFHCSALQQKKTEKNWQKTAKFSKA
jgi:hypothetical protein